MMNDGTPSAWINDPTQFEDLTLDVKDNLITYSDVKTIFSDATRCQFDLGWKDNEFDNEVFLHHVCTGSRMDQIRLSITLRPPGQNFNHVNQFEQYLI